MLRRILAGEGRMGDLDLLVQAANQKRATLHNYLATHFNKKLTGEEMKKAVEHLRQAGLIAGTEAAVTYNF